MSEPISLPPDLIPSDGRFGSGPSKVPTRALDALAATKGSYLGTSHRRPGVREVVGRIRSGLRDLYSLPDGYEVLLGNGGATTFWDAATFGLIDSRSLHYSFGEFSAKFAAAVAAAPHLDEPVIEDAAAGTAPAVIEPSDVDAVAFTHNETSTGVRMDPVRRGDALVLVDATSAAGAVETDPAAWDAYYFSPQKAFASEGGLWVALMSPEAIDRIESLDRWRPPSLDLRISVDESRKNQTYNTPALATLWLLAHQIDRIEEWGGLAVAAARSQMMSRVVYSWAESKSYAEPFVEDPDHRSTTVVTVDLVGVDADQIVADLRHNGIVDVAGYRKLARNQLRVATFPAIEADDLTTLLAAIDHLVERRTGGPH